MQFELTEEQRLIQQMVQDFARDHGTTEAVRAAISEPQAFNPEVWQLISHQLGLSGLLIAPEHSGQGLGLVEAVIVFEQLGAVLLPSPLLGTTVAALAIAGSGSEAQKARLLPMVAGGAIATLAEPAGARLAGGETGLRLDGRYEYVVDAAAAQMLLLPATYAGSQVLVVVDAQDAQIDTHVTLDQTRPLSTVVATDLLVEPDRVLAEDPARAIDRALQVGALLIGAEQAGAAATALTRTVAYAQDRQQFGRAIGSFQAVKHKMADMMIAVEAAISAVYFAACSAQEHPETLPEMAALAKAQGTETLNLCAADMVQLHGGIGFTWEGDAHLFFKRARGSSTMFGDLAAQDARIVAHLGLTGGET